MPIASMTGFARAAGEDDGYSWTWEARSVNGRGLDVRCRVPAGFEGLDVAARERVAGRFRRGNVSLTLTIARHQRHGAVRVNTDVLDGVLAVLPDLRRRLPEAPPPTVEGVLALRGVIDIVEDELDEDGRKAAEATLLVGLDRALDALAEMRAGEGGRLEPVLASHVQRIDALCGDAERLAAAQPQAIAERLREQVAALLDGTSPVPEDRLAQEIAILAAKADTREELDRLKSHCNAARGLLGEGGAIGRKLDFLCQEFNREANTICSKSADVELTRIGLELKASIDQLREQVQNIE